MTPAYPKGPQKDDPLEVGDDGEKAPAGVVEGVVEKEPRQNHADEKRQEESRTRLRQLAFATGIPLRLLSGPVVGFTMGYFLDAWLGSTPWLALLFGVLGFVAGVKSLVNALK